MSDRPLSGLRVVDLTHVLARPYCTYLLGLVRVEVIKVEVPAGEWGAALGLSSQRYCCRLRATYRPQP